MQKKPLRQRINIYSDDSNNKLYAQFSFLRIKVKIVNIYYSPPFLADNYDNWNTGTFVIMYKMLNKSKTKSRFYTTRIPLGHELGKVLCNPTGDKAQKVYEVYVTKLAHYKLTRR